MHHHFLLLPILLLQSQPKRVSKLETHHIKNLSCGDEFSIALDDNGISWVWGRDDLGQVTTKTGFID